MSEHLSESLLNDWADDALSAVQQGEVEQHIATCTQCSAAAYALRSLLGDLHALPATVEPPSSLRTAVRERIDAAPSQPALRLEAAPRVHWSDRSLRAMRLPLAAAAALLVALSATMTIWLGGNDEPDSAALAAALVDAEFADVEIRYREATKELETLLREVRAALPPGTIRLLDRDLAVLDAALLEARDALALDPGNPTLTSILLASYEKKLDLLRRAADAQTL
jgi:anti-sigma-K factor RskA